MVSLSCSQQRHGGQTVAEKLNKQPYWSFESDKVKMALHTAPPATTWEVRSSGYARRNINWSKGSADPMTTVCPECSHDLEVHFEDGCSACDCHISHLD